MLQLLQKPLEKPYFSLLPLCKDAQHGGSAAAVRIHTHVSNNHLKINHHTFRKVQPLSSHTALRVPKGHPIGKGTWDRAAGRVKSAKAFLCCPGNGCRWAQSIAWGTGHPTTCRAKEESKAQPCSPSLVALLAPTKPKAGAAPCSTAVAPSPPSPGCSPTARPICEIKVTLWHHYNLINPFPI